MVNYTDGYRMDVPFDWQEDYSLAALRTRYSNDHYMLTVTRETKNPYIGGIIMALIACILTVTNTLTG